MSDDPILKAQRLAESHGLEFEDCGNGHVQIKGHGQLVNYWPLSKRQTAHSPTLNRRETHCTPWDAVKLCMSNAKKGMKPKAKAGNGPDRSVNLEPTITNLSGLRNFYSDDTPPWDESLGEFEYIGADVMRAHAYQLEQQAQRERADANWIDGRVAA